MKKRILTVLNKSVAVLRENTPLTILLVASMAINLASGVVVFRGGFLGTQSSTSLVPFVESPRSEQTTDTSAGVVLASGGQPGLSGSGDPAILTATPKPEPVKSSSPIDVTQLYSRSCALCHGSDRQGKSGPALTAITMAGQTVAQIVSKLTTHQSQLSAAEREAIAKLLTPAPSTVPEAPSDLVATAASSNQVSLTWTDNSGDETGFRIERATDTAFSAGLASLTAGADAVSFDDNSVTAGTTYYYRVLASNVAGDSPWSNTATVSTSSTVTLPAAPSNLSASASGNQVSLSWSDNSNNEGGFRIQRATDSGFGAGATTLTAGAGANSYADDSVASGTTYYYRVLAYNDAGESAWSNTATASTPSTVTPSEPPSNLSATASGSQINLSWADNASNESGYRIQRATDSGFSAGSTTLTAGAGANSYSDASITAGTTYYYRVLAYNSAGDSAWSNTASASITTTPNATQLYAQNCASCHGASREGGYGPALTSSALAGWTSGQLMSKLTTHQSQLTAAERSTLATYLAPASPTVPAAPSSLTAMASSSGQINLSWADNASNENGYRLQRATDSGFGAGATTLTAGAGANSYSDASIAAGMTYYYRILAYNSAGDSAWSNTASASTPAEVTLPAAPSNLMATVVNGTQVNLTWTDNSGDETGFRLERATDSVFGSGLTGLTAAANASTLSDVSVVAGTTYYYRVLAGNAAGDSPWSNTVTVSTPAAVTVPVAPSNLTVTATNSTQVSLSWTDNSNNETGFRIQRATNSAFSAGTANFTATSAAVSYNDTSVAANTTYYYRVLANNAAGDSVWSNTASVSTPAIVTLPAAPSNLAASAASSNQVSLTWTDNANNETEFRIQRATNNAFSSGVANFTAPTGINTYSDASVAAGTNYYYRVQAANTAGVSAWSNTASVSTPATVTVPAAPSNLAASAANSTQVNLTWSDNSNNEVIFNIQRATNAAFSAGLTTMNATAGNSAYSDASIVANTTYYYRIRASNTAGTSPWSNTASVSTPAAITLPAPPSNLAATAVNSTQVSLSWTDNSNNEVSFNIQRATNSGFSAGLTNMTATAGAVTYSDTSVVASTTYYYRARASNAAGVSAWSGSATVTTPSALTAPATPSNLAATAVTSTRVNLTWTDNASNESGFRIQRATNSGFTAGLTNITAAAGVNTYSDTTVAQNTAYYFRILANNAAGDSAWSNTANVTTPASVTVPAAPSNLIATAISSTQVNLSWTDNSNNETGFRIQRATNSGFTAGIANFTAAAGINAYSNTGVVAGITYYYRVLATNTAGDSAWSNTATVATPSAVNSAQVYSQSCASCHGANRQGGSGPALTTTALASRTVSWLVNFIGGHRSGFTQTVLSALADFLKNTPP